MENDGKLWKIMENKCKMRENEIEFSKVTISFLTKIIKFFMNITISFWYFGPRSVALAPSTPVLSRKSCARLPTLATLSPPRPPAPALPFSSFLSRPRSPSVQIYLSPSLGTLECNA